MRPIMYRTQLRVRQRGQASDIPLQVRRKVQRPSRWVHPAHRGEVSLINGIHVIYVFPDLHRRIMEKLVLGNKWLAEIVDVEVSDVIDTDVVTPEPLHRLARN